MSPKAATSESVDEATMTAPSATINEDSALEKKSAQVRSDVAYARQRQEAILRGLSDRKAMPKGVRVGISRSEPDIELLRRLAPECLEPWVRENRSQTDEERRESRGVFHWGATHRALLDTAENHRKNMQLGWEPILEPDGSHAMYGSCLVYRRPVAISREHISAVEEMSDHWVAEQNKEAQSAQAETQRAIQVTSDETTVRRNVKPVSGFELQGSRG